MMYCGGARPLVRWKRAEREEGEIGGVFEVLHLLDSINYLNINQVQFYGLSDSELQF